MIQQDLNLKIFFFVWICREDIAHRRYKLRRDVEQTSLSVRRQENEALADYPRDGRLKPLSTYKREELRGGGGGG